MRGFGDAPAAAQALPPGSMPTPEQVDLGAMNDPSMQGLPGGNQSLLETLQDEQLTGPEYDAMLARQRAGGDPSLNDPFAGYGGSQGSLGITNPYVQQEPFAVSGGLRN